MNRPKPEEYSPFHQTYISLVGDGSVLDTLEYLKEISHTLFSNLSDDKANHAYAEGKWTIKQVLGHMIDAERTFAYRILAFSRGQEELPGFDENAYVDNATFQNRTIKDLAEEFSLTRESNLYLFRSLTPEQWDKTGIANGNSISVRALVYIAAGHELHHLGIIKQRYL